MAQVASMLRTVGDNQNAAEEAVATKKKNAEREEALTQLAEISARCTFCGASFFFGVASTSCLAAAAASSSFCFAAAACNSLTSSLFLFSAFLVSCFSALFLAASPDIITYTLPRRWVAACFGFCSGCGIGATLWYCVFRFGMLSVVLCFWVLGIAGGICELGIRKFVAAALMWLEEAEEMVRRW